jgi:tetratricopeptide (TPR) repeat protein
MTARTETTAPDEKPAAPAGRARAGKTRAPGRRVRTGTALLAALVAGLAGFNAWWYWRDTRPVADAKSVANWMRNGRYAEAEPALRERLRRAPHDGEARINLARVLGARDDLRDCAGQLHLVPHWWPTKAEALYREGSVYLMLDRAKDAEAAWLEVVKDDPLHPAPPDVFHDATFELLKLYATEDRWDDAYPVLWRAYDEATSVDRSTLLTWRMRSELERVAPLEALPRLRRYVAASPDDLEALRALARDELALGRLDEADRHFRACLKGRPADPRVWRDYLTMLYERGDWGAFSAALARVPEAASGEPEVCKFRGVAREKAGDLNGAAAEFRRAVEGNPNVIEYHHRLAFAEGRLGRPGQAAEHRKRAQELREARGRLSQAFADFLDARAGRATGGPDLATSARNLAVICKTLGMTRAAEGWAQLADAR